jgi:hypothetical protein
MASFFQRGGRVFLWGNISMVEDQSERQALLAEVADLMRALAEMARRFGRPGSPSLEEVQALLVRKEAVLARLRTREAYRQNEHKT